MCQALKVTILYIYRMSKEDLDLDLDMDKEVVLNTEDLQDPFAPGEDERDPDYIPDTEAKRNSKTKIRDYFNVKSLENPQPSVTMNIDDEYDDASMSTSTASSTGCLDLDVSPNESALFDGKFFKIISRTDDSRITANCQICIGAKSIKGKTTVTTNFIRHLKVKHATAFNDYTKYKSLKKHSLLKGKFNTKEKSLETEKKVQKPFKNSKQLDIRYSVAQASAITQDQFDQRLLQFVINTMSAVSVLSNPNFVQIFDGLNLNVMSRTTAMKKISVLSTNFFDNIKSSLQDMPFVCTTADIWSSKKKSFLGVTCHWIDQQSLQRKSIALACRRFSGTHSFDKIAEMLEDINNSFGLSETKIIGTVTDNGSNFVKAFKEFGINLQGDIILKTVLNQGQTEFDEESILEASELDDEDELVLPSSIISESDNQTNILLPNHFRCVTHTINLIATTDIIKTLNNSHSLRSKHTAIMNKCSLLWNKCGRPKSAEVIKETLGHYLSYPGVTRWNSYYDALAQIFKEKDKLNILFEKLDLKPHILKETDLDYIEEYLKILQPLAYAIDILQGDQNTYFGSVLPTIGSLYTKFHNMKLQNFKYLNSVVDSCLNSLKVRFANYFSLTNLSRFALIATITHPKFKLRWLTAFNHTGLVLNTNDLKNIVIHAVSELSPIEKKTESQSAISSENRLEHDFFEFEFNDTGDCSQLVSSLNEFELQYLQYLQDPLTDIAMLNKYPAIKRAFIKYNSVLPSSAPVERLFSFATFINSPRRHALSDENFENLVLLKANKYK